jgi:hypothetical protein
VPLRSSQVSQRGMIQVLACRSAPNIDPHPSKKFKGLANRSAPKVGQNAMPVYNGHAGEPAGIQADVRNVLTVAIWSTMARGSTFDSKLPLGIYVMKTRYSTSPRRIFYC